LPVGATQTSLGHFSTGSITLYTATTDTLTFTACGLPGVNVSVPVSHAATVGAIALSGTDSAPGAGATPALTNLQCPNGTGAAVACSPVFAFFYDAYGND